MTIDEPSPEVGQQLRAFFDALREAGYQRAALEGFIAKLERNGTLGEEAARLLREGSAEEIEAHLEAADPTEGYRWKIVWPF